MAKGILESQAGMGSDASLLLLLTQINLFYNFPSVITFPTVFVQSMFEYFQ